MKGYFILNTLIYQIKTEKNVFSLLLYTVTSYSHKHKLYCYVLQAENRFCKHVCVSATQTAHPQSI